MSIPVPVRGDPRERPPGFDRACGGSRNAADILHRSAEWREFQSTDSKGRRSQTANSVRRTAPGPETKTKTPSWFYPSALRQKLPLAGSQITSRFAPESSLNSALPHVRKVPEEAAVQS